jgi:DNA-binding transcriptional ArsR family regulator
VEVPESIYEMDEQGNLKLLGDPNKLALEEVLARVQEVLTAEWQLVKDIAKYLEEPSPSQESVRQALDTLGDRGLAERNPPLSEGRKPGNTYRWRAVQPNLQPTWSIDGGKVVGLSEKDSSDREVF